MNVLNWLFKPKPAPTPLPPPGPPEDTPGTVRDWTVLYYGNGNVADLDWDVNQAAESLGGIGTGPKVAFAAQVARHSQGGAARRLTFGGPRCANDYNVKVEQELGPTNMGDGKNLSDFLHWGMAKYPARHYMVVLAGHGGAFQGGYPDSLANDHLTHSELKEALAGRRVDVLVHASCFMACAEAAHSVAESVEFMVASEAVSTTRCPNLWTVGQKLRYHSEQGEVSAAQAVNLVFESVEHCTAEAAIAPGQMSRLTPQIRELADRLLATDTPPDTVRKVIRRALNFGQPLSDMTPPARYQQVRDLVSLANHLATAPEISDPALKKAARQVTEGVWGTGVVRGGSIGPEANLQGAKGLSIWAPTSGTPESDFAAYDETPFARETGWGKVVRKFGC